MSHVIQFFRFHLLINAYTNNIVNAITSLLVLQTILLVYGY